MEFDAVIDRRELSYKREAFCCEPIKATKRPSVLAAALRGL